MQERKNAGAQECGSARFLHARAPARLTLRIAAPAGAIRRRPAVPLYLAAPSAPRPMTRRSVLSALAAVVLAAPAAAQVPGPLPADYDAVASLDYETLVRPLLAARGVLSPVATDAPGDPADYSLGALVMAGPSGFVVPFDAAGSLMLRFVEDLPDSAALPFPNLRRLDADERRFVGRWIEAGARVSDGAAPAFSDATDLLFACLQGANTVDVLDAATMRIVRRVRFDDLGLPSAPYGPHHVAFEPGGGAWYVSLISGTPALGGAVAKLSTSLRLDPSDPAYLLGVARMTTPGMLAVDPSSGRLYVGRSTLSATTTTGFGIVDRAAMTVEEVATPFNVPHAMAVTPDGRFVLTASLTGDQAAVYDTATEDLAISDVPGGPHELIHFSILGAHRAAGEPAGMDHGTMDHAGMDHGTTPAAGTNHAGMDHGSMVHGTTPVAGTDHAATGHAATPAAGYRATLTSRTTDSVLFYALSADGALTLTATAPGGDGPWHAHLAHDGRTMLIPDRNADTVTILDADTRTTVRTVAASAPAGPLSQPHSPAPDHTGERFFVTSSNLNGAWMPAYRFLGPAGPDGTRALLPASRFSNVTAFSMDGAVIETVQLGTYASGLEPFTVGVGGHESM